MQGRTVTIALIAAALLATTYGATRPSENERPHDLFLRFLQGQTDTLGGLKGVHVIVQGPSARVISGELTHESLQTAVEQHLHKCGIEVLSAEDAALIPGQPFLHVKVSGMPAHGMNYNVALTATASLYQTVSLARDPNLTYYAITWHIASLSNVVGRPKPVTARRTIHDLVAMFTEHYLRANPGVGETVREQSARRRELRQRTLDLQTLFVGPDISDFLPPGNLDPPGWSGEREYTGIFSYALEHQDFQPDMSSEHWWLDVDSNVLRPFLERLANENASPASARLQCHIKVRGKLSPRGKYGHFGQWKRELSVDQILEYEASSPK